MGIQSKEGARHPGEVLTKEWHVSQTLNSIEQKRRRSRTLQVRGPHEQRQEDIPIHQVEPPEDARGNRASKTGLTMRVSNPML